MLVPPIVGTRKAAEQFVLANTIAVLISGATLYPAIGPWAGYHFPGNEAQKACQAGSALFMVVTGTLPLWELFVFRPST
jgi:hypothetical protein